MFYKIKQLLQSQPQETFNFQNKVYQETIKRSEGSVPLRYCVFVDNALLRKSSLNLLFQKSLFVAKTVIKQQDQAKVHLLFACVQQQGEERLVEGKLILAWSLFEDTSNYIMEDNRVRHETQSSRITISSRFCNNGRD